MNNTLDNRRVEVKYKIESIKVLDFAIHVPENIQESITDAFFEFYTGIQIVLNENRINIRFQTKVYDYKTKKTCYSNLTMLYSFKILGMESFQLRKNMVKVPDELMITLVGIAYSTTRGIFYEKFAGTYLRDIFLPPMNPKILIPKVKDKKKQVKPIERKRANKIKQQNNS